MEMYQGRTARRSDMLVARIVVPVERTDRESVSQRWAAAFAATGVPITAVHVDAALDDGPTDRFAYLERMCERWNADLETRELAGTDAAATLLDERDPLDLVVGDPAPRRRPPRRQRHRGPDPRRALPGAGAPDRVGRPPSR